MSPPVWSWEGCASEKKLFRRGWRPRQPASRHWDFARHLYSRAKQTALCAAERRGRRSLRYGNHITLSKLITLQRAPHPSAPMALPPSPKGRQGADRACGAAGGRGRPPLQYIFLLSSTIWDFCKGEVPCGTLRTAFPTVFALHSSNIYLPTKWQVPCRG
jgi:hypothetical protein